MVSARWSRAGPVVLLMLLLTACTAGSSDTDRSATTSRPAATEALLAAAYRNDLPAAEAAIADGADVNANDGTQQSAYLISTSEVGDDPRLLELTLAHGADVRAKDRYDGTGLIRAADRGHVAVVRRLLATPIDRDHVNRLGWTALLETIILGGGDPQHVEVARLLIGAGADVTIADREGVTPLAHAQQRGQEPIVAMLRAAGAR